MSRFNIFISKETAGTWLASLTGFFVLLLVMASFFGYQNHASQISSAQNLLQTELHEASGHIAVELSDATDSARYIAALNSLVAFSQGDNTRKADAEQALHQLMSINEELMQARLINEDGQETLRLNRKNDLIRTVEADELQNKAHRYYVQAGLKLYPGQTLISEIDFNIERGILEIPLRPVVRIVAPVFDRTGQRHGLFVINYAMKAAMAEFQSRVLTGDADAWMVANQGHWLLPPANYPELTDASHVEGNFIELHPQLWEHINRAPYQRFTDINGWFVSRPITIPAGSLTTPAALQQLGWLIAHLPSSALQWHPEQQLKRWKGPMLIVLAIVGLLSLMLLLSRKREAEAKQQNRLQKEKLRLSGVIFDTTAEGLIVTDTDNKIVACNESASRITGYAEHEMLGETPQLWASRKHDNEHYLDMWRQLKLNGQWQGEFINRRKNGELFTALENISAVYDDDGKLTNYIAIMADISDLKKTQAQLHQLAYHDTLTQLPNRRMFRESLNRAIENHKRQQQPFALALMDLDNFKVVNDSLGHVVGDKLLQRVAARLKDITRSQDSLCRLGGDEFGLLMSQADSSSTIAASMQRILNVIQDPIDIEGREIRPRCSIGIAMYPQDADSTDDLFKAADAAMYASKSSGRHKFSFHTAQMNEQANRRLEIENQLRDALNQNLLELYYQPQVKLENEQVVGLEALLRWHHPARGLVSAGEFIPVAEETGLIHDLGNWVWRNACRQAAHWEKMGLHGIRIALNLSGHQLADTSLPTQIIHSVNRDPSVGKKLSIELEMTETMLMGTPRLISLLDQFKSNGIKLALDDFGTGYSSLAQLRRLPVSRLKIAGVFIREMLDDRESQAIVRSIVHPGTDLGMKVLAEEVETAEQRDVLRELGCHEAQGYYFYQPMPVSDIESLLFAKV